MNMNRDSQLAIRITTRDRIGGKRSRICLGLLAVLAVCWAGTLKCASAATPPAASPSPAPSADPVLTDIQSSIAQLKADIERAKLEQAEDEKRKGKDPELLQSIELRKNTIADLERQQKDLEAKEINYKNSLLLSGPPSPPTTGTPKPDKPAIFDDRKKKDQIEHPVPLDTTKDLHTGDRSSLPGGSGGLDGAEVPAGADPGAGGDSSAPGGLATVIGANNSKVVSSVNAGIANQAGNTQVATASGAGDPSVQLGQTIVSDAQGNSQILLGNTATTTAQQQQNNSAPNMFGTAVISGATTGAMTTAAAFGNTAGANLGPQTNGGGHVDAPTPTTPPGTPTGNDHVTPPHDSHDHHPTPPDGNDRGNPGTPPSSQSPPDDPGGCGDGSGSCC